MKKRLITLIIVLLFLPMINASSIAISPTSQKFFFEPYLEKNFTYRISDSNPLQLIELYVIGDLSQYVTLSTNSLIGAGSVDVFLKFPQEIIPPGEHRIIVGARESTQGNNVSGSVRGISAIQVPIDIMVPYPGKYAEAKFELSRINKGELAKYLIEINNFGTEEITANVRIDIYEGSGIKKTIVLDPQNIKSKDRTFIADYINSSDFTPGAFPVFVTIDYGKIIELKDLLKIGMMYLNITDYSDMFVPGKPAKFYVEAENLWNLDMKKVYAEVSITDKGYILDQFKLGFIDLRAWEKANLTGYFDLTNVSQGNYVANIRLFYENQSNSKLVSIHVKNPIETPWYRTPNFYFISLTIVFVILVLFLAYRVLLLDRPRNQDNNTKSFQVNKKLKSIKVK